MNKRHFYYSLPIFLLLIVIVAGWLAMDYLGNKARREIIGESETSVIILSIHISSTLDNLKGAVKSLAGSPWISPALMAKREQDIERANSTLDRYNYALNASVSYLMDADGLTMASSNRNDPDSFVGKSYRFRPYFQKAAQGQPDHYFALGITSTKRGFYASNPVQNRSGKVLGVVTMKKNLDEMETFFSKYPFCFFINPDGIIFLSSSPTMVLKSLWPLDKALRETLIVSKQFGNQRFETGFLKKEIADGMEVTFEGKDYLVSRKVIDNNGWSIVLLTPTDRIRIYKWIGILATFSVGALLMVFLGIIYITDRSQEAIRQSEESQRLLLQAAGEGIFGLDAAGQVTFVNPAALSMLGFSEEEMLGQRMHALIHHSHQDGSNYPVEDCPMVASYTKATECRVMDEFFWRKAGSSFPVEYSSTPIIRGSSVIGVVVTFKDITTRKHLEEKIQQMAYHDSLTGLPNRILFLDRLTMAMSQSDRNRKKVAIMMLDLDKFKEVNDTLGHHIGDLLLQAVAAKLTGILRKGDTIARFGGDEFVLVLPEQKDAQTALQVARKIIDVFRSAVVLEGHSLLITSSIGISLYPDHGPDIDSILANADIAMYQAKQAGGDQYQLCKKD